MTNYNFLKVGGKSGSIGFQTVFDRAKKFITYFDAKKRQTSLDGFTQLDNGTYSEKKKFILNSNLHIMKKDS